MNKEKRIIPFSPPDVGESEAEEMCAVLSSGWITTGPRTKQFEKRLKEYIGADGLACLSSATAAEELNFRILGIGPGDEVIVPAYTYTASASAAIHCGARVVFVDIMKDGNPENGMPELDPDALKRVVNKKTKAVVPVDIGGIVCDYDRIYDVADSYRRLFEPSRFDGGELEEFSYSIQSSIGRVAVVADCAHSLGASSLYQGKRIKSGAIADFSSFSFHAVKNLTTAEGGASVWRSIKGVDDAEIYRFYQLLSLHGQSKDALAKTVAGSWEYDVIGPWYKCNMTDLSASIGLKQLDRYESLLKRRKEITLKYDSVCDQLGIIHLMHDTDRVSSSNHLYFIRIPGAEEDERNRLISSMAENGVVANVHYKPLPMMTAYRRLGWDIKDFPNSYNYYRNLISLPLHTLLSDEDVEYVCYVLKKVVGNRRA